MATNNRLELTFTRDFIVDEKIILNIGNIDTGFGAQYTFEWVNTVSAGFEVEVGTPTATPGETSAINFTTAWQNSLVGFTISQASNVVTITSSDQSFLNISAVDDNNNPLQIPTDYDYTFTTVTTGNKITYSDKVGLTPKLTHINQWWDDDANEVKTKFNLNDDRIGQNETDISDLQDELDDKANLAGGNIFDGDQEINGNLTVDTTAGELDIKNAGVGSIEIEGSGSIVIDATANLRFETNGVEHFTVLQNGAVGVGNTSPSSSYALDVGGDVNAADFLGDWNSLQTSDFVRSTDGVTEDVTGAKTFTNDDTTFGTGGQVNTITILGDTGEDLTVTKNLDGSVSFENTNNEDYEFNGNVNVIDGNYLISDILLLNTVVFSSLPSAGTAGRVAVISDASGKSYGAVAAGGGSDTAIVLDDGTNWIYS